MFKRLNISQKVLYAFMVIGILNIIFGAVAIYSLFHIKKVALDMNEEFVPESKLAVELEKHLTQTMIEMRGLSLTFQKDYFTRATNNILDVEEHVNELVKLVEGTHELHEAQKLSPLIKEKVTSYRPMIDQAGKRADEVSVLRDEMLTLALNATQEVNGILKSFEDSLVASHKSGSKSDLLTEKMNKYTLAQKILGEINIIRIVNFRGQLLRKFDLIEKLSDNFNQCKTYIAELEKTNLSAKEKDQLKSLIEKIDLYQKGQTKLLETLKSNDIEFEKSEGVLYSINELVSALSKEGMDDVTEGANNMLGTTTKTTLVLATVFLVVLVIAITVSIVIVLALKGVAAKMLESTQAVTQTSSQISDGNQDLSNRTQQQASSLEETSSTIEEITSTVKQTTDNAQKASQLSTGAVEVANAGSALSENVVAAMGEITKSSIKISEIVSLVDEIAFQTNILAINAAIEAAKAGEQGKGFAVVAIEVRDLAQRSADAAKEIKDLIDTSISKVKAGDLLVKENTEKLKEITTKVQEVADIMSEISASSREQYTAVEQINKAVANLDSMTQQNSSLVEEIASSSENMTSEALAMEKIVRENFSVDSVHQEVLAEVKNEVLNKVDSLKEIKSKVIAKTQAVIKKSTDKVPALKKIPLKVLPGEGKREEKKPKVFPSDGSDPVESILARGAVSGDEGEDF